MTVLNHSIPADLVAGVRAADEQVLEHAFQEMYPALLAEADQALHDLPSASRVVERAFLEVLAEPAIEDPNALQHALDQAMHQAIVREQSRIAALRRFEHNEHVVHAPGKKAEPVGAATAWKHIQAVRARSSAPRVAPDLREAQQHAAEHMAAALKERHRWSIPLIVLAVVALCAATYGLVRIQPRPSETFIASQLSASTARTINAAAGRIGTVTLTDESSVKIGAGSAVKLVNDFGETLRALSVQGAVSIAVAPAKRPLEIRAGTLAISAAGGKLDIAVEPERPVVVRVVEGAPRLTVGDSSWVAAAGQSFAVSGTTFRAASPAELDGAFAWMDGRFVVNGTVRDVVAGIRRWYDVDVGIGDASIAEWPASVSGSLESLSSSIASLESSAKVRMEWQNRHMLLFRR